MNSRVLCLAFIVIFLLGCGDANHHMSLNDESGFNTSWDAKENTLKIEGWDKPFALFFYTTMCAQCADQIPVMNAINSEFKDKVKIIGVMDDTLGFDNDIGVLATKGVKFMTTSTPKSVAFFQKIIGGIPGTPVTALFDKNGKRIKQWTGLFSKSEFMSFIAK